MSGPSRRIDELYQSDLFREFRPEQLRQLEPELEAVELAGGEVLFREGDPPHDGLYLVTRGRVLASALRPDGSIETLGELGRGEALGELGLITGRPRLATVRALRDTSLLRLTNSGFEQLVHNHPRVCLDLARQVVDRFEEQRRPPPPTTFGTLAVLPLVPHDWVGDFALRLASAMAQLGSTALVRASALDHQHGPGAAQADADDPRHSQIVEWLDLLESEHQTVVYLAEPRASPWTLRCLRQADRVLLVAAADDPPEVTALEQRAHERRDHHVAPPRVELALVSHPGQALRAAPWLGRPGLHAHHPIRFEQRPDFDRLARRLSDRAIGLVLGGGGSRAIAHIGVLRALEEARVPIDLVAATSAGAIVGAMFALGWDSHTIEHRVQRLARLRYWLPDFGPPIVSLLGGHGIRAALRRFYGDRQVENLGLPLHAVAASLTRGELVVMDRGPIWEAVRASLTLPAVWPPLERDGDLLVDGGLLDNLPAGVLAHHCAGGRVIACSVAQATRRPVEERYGDRLSGWRALGSLASQMLPWGRRRDLPLLPEVLLRSASLASARRLAETRARHIDLFLEPAVEHYGMFEVSRRKVIEEVIDIGYRHTRDRLADWSWETPSRPAHPRLSARPA